MYKSILAISEGGPDAAMSFHLAAQIAGLFDATVDAVHFSEDRRGDADIALQSMPFLKADSDTRVEGRAHRSERAYRELIIPLCGATFSGPGLKRDRLVAMGRESSLLLTAPRARGDLALAAISVGYSALQQSEKTRGFVMWKALVAGLFVLAFAGATRQRLR